jgi:peptidoglycan-N-acetylglucosamine deacetylase
MAPARLTVCLSFDFDALSLWVRAKSPSDLSRGEFGAVAIERILRLLDRYGIPATFFVPGHTALAYPQHTKMIVEHGHEIGHHGFVHEMPSLIDERAEREALVRGLDALERVAGVRPAGYRAPGWAVSRDTFTLLLEHGFTYDSSLMGHDTSAYFVRLGDEWSASQPYAFGDPSPLVELPISWSLDDYPAFEVVPGRNAGYSAPSAVEEIWRGDFDWAYGYDALAPHAFLVYTMHPQVIGRGHRMLMLERLIRYFGEHADVAYATCATVASRFAQSASPSGAATADGEGVQPRDGS